MKKSFVILALSCIVLIGTALRVSAQTTEKKLSYNLINEYGTFVGGNGNSEGDYGLTGVFINSLQFNKTHNLIGIGAGYEISTVAGQCIPLFLNYRHYFDLNKKIMPFLNVAAGTLFNFWNLYDYEGPFSGTPYATFYGFGLYSTIASGFKAGAFSLSTGFFLKSRPSDHNNLYGGIEVKAGYTF